MAILPDQDLGFSGTSTTTITVSGTFPAGALILVAVGFGTATSGQSISQSGSAFTNIVTRENSATNNLVYWNGYISNWAGGALSTTFTLSGAGKDAGARLLSFTGGKTISPILVSKDAGGAPSSTTFDTTAGAGTALANCLLVGFFTFANTASLVAPISQSGSPPLGWNRTAVSDGSSGNTPHGHAIFTWQILGSQPIASPQATLISGSARSYSATIVAFQEDYNPTIDFAVPLLQLARLVTAPGGTLTGAATGQFTYSAAALSDGAASAQETYSAAALSNGEVSSQETYTATATAVIVLTGAATGQETYTANALSNGEASSQETYSATAQPLTIVPGAATGQETYSAAALSNGEASSQETYSASATGVLISGASATGQFTYTASALSNGMALFLALFTASASGVLVAPAAGPLITPVGSIAAGLEPAGSAAAGKEPSGSIALGTVPAGTITSGKAPSGTIATGQEPSGSIVRN